MSFALLALLCAVAMLGPVLSLNRVVHIPVVIGELLVGMVLGRSGFQVIDSNNTILAFLAQIGFALVMFVAGTHVPLRQASMVRGLARGILRAIAVSVLAIPLGLLVASLFGTGHGAVYAVVIASSSASIVMPALGGVRVSSPAGIEMLVQLAVADASSIIILPLVLEPQRAGVTALGAAAVLLVAAVFSMVLMWARRTGYWHRVHHLSEERGLAIELRMTLTMLFALAAIAVSMGVSVMLAGFAMGLAMAAAHEPHRVANQTFAITQGFFEPIFFVWVGSSLDLHSLIADPQAILLGICLAVASLVAHGLLAVSHQPWPIALATSAQLGVPVGAVAMGKTLGVFSSGEATALLLGALITILVVTVLSGRLLDAVTGGPAGETARVDSASSPKDQ
ncbi:cation:proton antiporter [Bifidobacterium psychraerophilum]|uniref:Sodium/hydrogen exchanger n=1 Tax=Bifidobacterium psychraerophilum TaxID=218140 RepID=A0A087CJB5_9BIFI|nr:cation:proton antiporter [Bifidobacterium psychraerophilum]KFI83365.1 sodium/hydrogen exchanger [Bifidobacterium psychraerophilum]PKA94418.1 transporter (CPA2 family) [Bifidobacterium psychraerophilum DSM 22366]